MTVTQADIDRLRWFHDFDFPGGLHARSADADSSVMQRILWWFIAEQLRRVELGGRRVLDVGCWDGYFSFLAEERGAASVHAVDDASQNWGSPECFRLAHTLKQSRVEYHPDVSVYRLRQGVQGPFDVVLFLGVYYHLHAPYAALAEIRAMCHDESVVVVEGECLRDDERSYAEVNLTDPRASAFVPTTRLLLDLLRSCYLEPEHVTYLGDIGVPAMLDRVPPADVLKLIARRRQSARAAAPGPAGDGGAAAPRRDRAFIVARPFTGRNSVHAYRPPFGLDRFDDPAAFTLDR